MGASRFGLRLPVKAHVRVNKLRASARFVARMTRIRLPTGNDGPIVATMIARAGPVSLWGRLPVGAVSPSLESVNSVLGGRYIECHCGAVDQIMDRQ